MLGMASFSKPEDIIKKAQERSQLKMSEKELQALLARGRVPGANPALDQSVLRRVMAKSGGAQVPVEQQECIFCKIVNKEVESYVVYENKSISVVLDITPVNLGHLLIIPKLHMQNFTDLPAEVQDDMFLMARRLLRPIKMAGAEGINVLLSEGGVSGQQHSHSVLNIIPRAKNDGMFIEIPKKQVSSEQLNLIAGNIRLELQKELAPPKEEEQIFDFSPPRKNP